MRAFLPSLGLLVSLGLPTSAHHCATWTTTTPEVDTGPFPAGPRYYVDQRENYFGEGILGHDYWVYEETNGIPGLQSADEVIDDTCHGMIRGDTIFF